MEPMNTVKITDLPLEVLTAIMAKSEVDGIMRCACKLFSIIPSKRHVLSTTIITTPQLLQWARSTGICETFERAEQDEHYFSSQEIIEWYIQRDDLSNISMGWGYVTLRGDLDLLKWAFNYIVPQGLPNSNMRILDNTCVSVMRTATEFCHFHILEWGLENGFDISDPYLFLAAAHKPENFEVMEWLLDHGTEIYTTTVVEAVRHGFLDLFSYAIHDVACEDDHDYTKMLEDVNSVAAQYGHIHILQWIHDNENEFPISIHELFVFTSAAKFRREEVLVWLRSTGYHPLDDWTMDTAKLWLNPNDFYWALQIVNQ